MILDVGCGENPQGDINVDLFINSRHVIQHQKTPVKTNANIVADGNYLPFKDNCFDKVESHHTIEHILTPLRFFKELVRVAHKEIELTCPHRFSSRAKMPYHVKYFNKTWFAKACGLLGLRKNTIRVSLEVFKIWKFVFPLVRPHEITVKIRKE